MFPRMRNKVMSKLMLGLLGQPMQPEAESNSSE